MTVVRVTLSPDLSQFVEAEVLRGDYNSVSAVVDRALRLMKAEREQEAEKETALSCEVASGLAEARAGQMSTRSIRDIARAVIDGTAGD